jgi:hypothetical protein
MSIFQLGVLGHTRRIPVRSWEAELEKIAPVAGMRAEITSVVPNGETRTMSRFLSRIRYDRTRDEIELHLCGVRGFAAGVRLYLARPSHVDVERTPSRTKITVREDGGMVTTVSLFESEPPIANMKVTGSRRAHREEHAEADRAAARPGPLH